MNKLPLIVLVCYGRSDGWLACPQDTAGREDLIEVTTRRQQKADSELDYQVIVVREGA